MISATGGELLQRLLREDSLTESEVAYYIRQVLLAVEYMHSQNVVHLDLKVIFIYIIYQIWAMCTKNVSLEVQKLVWT